MAPPPTEATRAWRGDEPAARPASPYAVFDACPHCDGEMRPEHAHYRCSACGWRDSCCD